MSTRGRFTQAPRHPEAVQMGLTSAAHWDLVSWRTGFACYMLLAAGLDEAESRGMNVRVEWSRGRPVKQP
jgi:hypothetical protein